MYAPDDTREKSVTDPITLPQPNQDGAAPARPHRSAARRVLPLETLLWSVLLIAAIGTRFWNLGYRTVHHDESLHVYFSWIYSTGESLYIHNPLTHGPFLFEANALIYKIFGANDMTSRLLPAFFGVALVMMPWLLRGRQFLGPWGALATGYMLLISPAFLYYTRYIRHDPYTAGGSLLLTIAIFRYLDKPARRWMIIAFACVAFLLANHEIAYAIFLGMVVILWGSLVVHRLHWTIPVQLAALVLAAGDYLLLKDRRPLPAIPWQNPTPEATRQFYGDLFTHPMVIGLIIVAVMFVVAMAVVMIWMARRSPRTGSFNDRLFGDAAPGTVSYGVWSMLRDPIGLLTGVVLAVVMLVLLFTTFLQNMNGLKTMTYAPNGTLLYWLGQHGVQRGEQPWFYFITEGFQYEWLGIFFTLAGVAVIAWRTLRLLRSGEPGPTTLFNVFNAWWFIFMFLVLSWAGEKMPWLIIHFALPGFLVSGALINEIVEGAIAWKHQQGQARTFLQRYGAMALTLGLVLCAFAAFFLTARFTYGSWGTGDTGAVERQLSRATLGSWWQLAVPPLIALYLLAMGVWVIGRRRTAYSTITAAFVVFSLFQIHQGWRMAFLDGDVAVDTLIYNTTSPDVTDVTADLHALSDQLYGDTSIGVGYENCIAWPYNWYLRDFSNRRVVSASTLPTGADQLPVLLSGPMGDCSLPQQIPGYTMQSYVLRWHEPEQQVYREFAIAPEIPVGRSAWHAADDPHDIGAIIGSIWSSLMSITTVQGQQHLFRMMMFREMPAGLITYEFRIYVRNDLLPDFNRIRYGE